MKKPEKLTPILAMKYKCWDCQGEYLDGKSDCLGTRCPIYSFLKYAKCEPDLWFMEFNPTRPGRVKWEDCRTTERTEAQKQASIIALAKWRKEHGKDKSRKGN